MRNKPSLLLLLMLLCGSPDYLRGQYQYLLPGVTDEIVSAIQARVNTAISDKYQVGQVLNVDSSLGSGLSPRWPDVGPVEDPYGTLTHCFVFNATRKPDASPADSADGIVGVFREGQILWHSNGILTVELPGMVANTIWAIKDINRDGKVDFLTTWITGSMGTNPPMCLWIISWDGQQGTIINARDEDKQSTLMIDSYALFLLADIEGDGIWEIQGQVSFYGEDSLQTVFRTFSWNGSLYGFWPNTPQPAEYTSFPQDRVQVTVDAKVTPIGDKYQYRYHVHSLQSSFQDLREFAIDRLVDSVQFGAARRAWDAIKWISLFDWQCFGLDGETYMRPDESDSSFTFVTVTSTLPAIEKFYARGWNAESNNLKEILFNSFRGLTIGPADPPSPCVPLDFLDTMISYTTQSRSLGWITDQTAADRYLGYFSQAKTHLQENNTGGARTTLQSVFHDVDVDSSSTLTSEAYALLRYDTEYLLNQLPAPQEFSIDDLITLKHRAEAQGWIGDGNFVKELDNGLENAKKHLARGDSVNCAKELEKFQEKVKKEYEKTVEDQRRNKPRDNRFVTEEGYRSLMEGGQRIIDRLPKKK